MPFGDAVRTLAVVLDGDESARTTDTARRRITRACLLGYLHKEIGLTGAADGCRKVRIVGDARVAIRLRVPRVGEQRILATTRLREGPTARRAECYAVVLPVAGDPDPHPLARATKELLTGVPDRTQQRYESYAGHVVQTCYALDERYLGAALVRGQGYFGDPQGRQWRRLPDIVVAKHQRQGSGRARQRVDAQIKRRWPEVANARRDRLLEQRPGSNGLYREGRGPLVYAIAHDFTHASRRVTGRRTRDVERVLGWTRGRRKIFLIPPRRSRE